MPEANARETQEGVPISHEFYCAQQIESPGLSKGGCQLDTSMSLARYREVAVCLRTSLICVILLVSAGEEEMYVLHSSALAVL